MADDKGRFAVRVLFPYASSSFEFHSQKTRPEAHQFIDDPTVKVAQERFSPIVGAEWQFADSWHVFVDYFGQDIQREKDVRGRIYVLNTFPVTATVRAETHLAFQNYSLLGGRKLMEGDAWFVGALAGVSIVQAQVQAHSINVSSFKDYSNEGVAPYPVLGVFGQYRLSGNESLEYRAWGSKLEIGKARGEHYRIDLNYARALSDGLRLLIGGMHSQARVSASLREYERSGMVRYFSPYIGVAYHF